MAEVHVIRHKVLREGLSIRAVAQQMGLSRNTVRKYLKEPEPVRKARRKRTQPVLAAVSPRIDALLQELQGCTTAKQRLTGTGLHRQLVEEGYQVGITTVRDYLREQRRQAAEVYIPAAAIRAVHQRHRGDVEDGTEHGTQLSRCGRPASVCARTTPPFGGDAVYALPTPAVGAGLPQCPPALS